MSYYLKKDENKENSIFNLRNVLIFLGILIIIIICNSNKSKSRENQSRNSTSSISKSKSKKSSSSDLRNSLMIESLDLYS